jgi:lysozyme
MRSTNAAGIDLIKHFEGLSLRAYPDPATHGPPWTIGYGHTGPEVVPGQVISEGQAHALLKADVAKFEAGVAKLAPKTTDNQFAALVSFAYNCGLANLKASTLLRLHNAGDYVGAAKQFFRWNRGAGKILSGLTRRRAAESELYKKD